MIVIDMDMPLSCYDCKLQDACGLAIINHHRRDKRDKFCPIKCEIKDIRADIEHEGAMFPDGEFFVSIDRINEIFDNHTKV